MKIKNIWIINQYCGSPEYGMGYRSYYLAKEFVNKGIEVNVFSGSFSHQFVKTPQIKGLWSREDIDSIKYNWIRTIKYHNTNSPLRILSWFQFITTLLIFPFKKINKPDCIIVSSISMLPIINGYLLKKRYGCELIFEVRDIWPLSAIELGGYSPNHPFIRFLQYIEDFAYKKADKVASVLPNAYEHMKTRGLDLSKYFYVPNGINPNDFTNAVFDKCSHITDSLPDEKFIVGYAGSFNVSNNLDILIESIIELKDNKKILFVLVGKGPLLAKIIDKKLEYKLDNLLIFDPIPKKSIPTLLKSFDACFVGLKGKSIYRFGISVTKIFDYLYSQKPVISQMNVFENPIENAKCGFNVDSLSSSELSNAISKMSSLSKEQLTEMGSNGKIYVEKHHLYNKIAENYLKEIIK